MFPTIVDGLRADWVHRWNGEVKREFRIGERAALQIGLNIVNLTNNTLLTGPNVDPLSSDFGRCLSNLPSTWELTALVEFRF